MMHHEKRDRSREETRAAAVRLGQPVRPAPIGDVASMAGLVERIDRIGGKLNSLIAMMTPLFSNPTMRQAIAGAVTSHGLKVNRR